jgi:hypothetical protein
MGNIRIRKGCDLVSPLAPGLDLALHSLESTGAPARRAGAGPHRSTTRRHHPHADGGAPCYGKGGPMSSIVYVVGAVVIIGVLLKMLGVY